jgi:anti-anti-sigma factor
MSITLEDVGTVKVVHVTGEVDMATEGQLRRTVTEAMAGEPVALVLDFTDVTFFASAGLHVVVDVQHDATARGMDLRVVADKRSVLRPLQITGVDQLVTVVASLDQALAHS